MSETNYGVLGVTVPTETGMAPDVPLAFKTFADSIGAGQTAGKLLIVQSTGAAAWKAMSGDATIDKNGALTISDGAVSSRKLKPTVGIFSSSGSMNLPEALTDVAGAVLEITPSVASILKVVATFDFEVITGTSLRTLTGTLGLDGVDQTQTAVYKTTATGGLVSVTQVYSLALTAAKHTIKMRAKSDVAENGRVTKNTRALYELVAA